MKRSNVNPTAGGGRASASARERLGEMIGELSGGDRILPEPALATELKVSRAKLREMLRSFEDAGLITRRPGVGTVIAHRPKLRNDLSINTGVTDLINAHGLKPGTRELRVERRPATGTEAAELSLPPEDEVWAVTRVRTADDRPVVDSCDVMPEEIIGRDPSQSLSLTELADGSLYGCLSDRRQQIHHGVVRIAPMQADRELAERLEVDAGTLLLRLIQVDYSPSGRPAMLSVEHHVADAFEVTVLRRGPNA